MIVIKSKLLTETSHFERQSRDCVRLTINIFVILYDDFELQNKTINFLIVLKYKRTAIIIRKFYFSSKIWLIQITNSDCSNLNFCDL